MKEVKYYLPVAFSLESLKGKKFFPLGLIPNL